MFCVECGLTFTKRKIKVARTDGSNEEPIYQEVWACWVCYDEEFTDDRGK